MQKNGTFDIGHLYSKNKVDENTTVNKKALYNLQIIKNLH